MPGRKIIILSKSLVWGVCLAPLVRLAVRGLTTGLGANPIEFITLSTGTWTLVWLLTTLAISPLRAVTGWNLLIRFRRLLGLFAFFYGALHFTTYIWLDKFFDVSEMFHDIVKRRFITAGMFAFSLMIPLAVTSTAAAIRRLGGRNWQRLHRLVYLSAAAAVVHFWWKVKADVREPAIYGAVLVALLLARGGTALAARRRGHSSFPPNASASSGDAARK
jgi:methionine sulfoxide reductase heme-binding subunit